MTQKQLYEYLRAEKDKEAATKAALQFLGKDAQEWYEVRQSIKDNHIFDATTMKWKKTFVANGVTYHVVDPADGLPLKRYSKMKIAFAVNGDDAPLGEIQQSNYRMRKHFNDMMKTADGASALGKEIEDRIARIQNLATRNWDNTFYTATLFINRVGEDLTDWDEADAENKMEDWNKAGIPAIDFFFLIIYWGATLSEEWMQLQTRLRAMMGVL